MSNQQQYNFIFVQFAPIGGDLRYNQLKIEQKVHDIMQQHDNIDAIFFPEMALCGYDLGDMFNFKPFIDACMQTLSNLADNLKNAPPIFIGTVSAYPKENALLYEDKSYDYYNSVALIQNGQYDIIRHKHQLPTADIFDEKRLFKQQALQGPVNVNGLPIGLLICEDVWHEEPIETLHEAGSRLLVVLNGSPYHNKQKHEQRLQIAAYQARHYETPIIYLNLAGGHDELVFDGRSFALDAQGNVTHHAKAFDEDVMLITYKQNPNMPSLNIANSYISAQLPDDMMQYKALVLGLRHYVQQSGFTKVVLGLSGGADSALTAVIAADALGAENVLAILLPSQYSSNASLQDANKLAADFNIKTHNISIHDMHQLTLQIIRPLCPDIADQETLGLSGENAQARIRGLLLMTLANAQERLLLTTGNKSELALGYSTLYGDSCGAYNPIIDLYKTEVYAMIATRNKYKGQYGLIDAAIDNNIIEKAPSAELRPNQKDTDTLPPYEELDPILQSFIEGHGETITEPNNLQADIWQKFCRAEFKRKQAAPGTKISTRSFGIGWRFPLINHFTLFKKLDKN